MNIIHILGITILLMDTSHSAIEEPKNKIQKALLRKLQSYQPDENKPLMWNEVLADVLVNKIRIFSFKKHEKETGVKEDLTQKSELTNFISQVFIIYKKFVYDVFGGTQNTSSNTNPAETDKFTPDIEERKADTDEMTVENEITFSDGPKSEVELVEPKYHGKQFLGNGTEKNETSEDIGEDNVQENAEELGEESVKGCPEGTVEVEGKCVVTSRLIMAVPSQCPIGYMRDRLGFCRMVF